MAISLPLSRADTYAVLGSVIGKVGIEKFSPVLIHDDATR